MTDTIKYKDLVGRDPLERAAFLQAAIDGIARFEQRGTRPVTAQRGFAETYLAIARGDVSQHQNMFAYKPDVPKPRARLLDPDFVYTSGADVQATWRRHGWVPIAERVK